MTERLHFSLSCIGEEYGNPLQCSCLENPRDGGVWWAAIYGVAQSRTWLKRLSSSSSSNLQSKQYVLLLSCFNHIQLCATLWAVAGLPPLSTGFSRQEYWSGLLWLPGYFLIQGSNPGLLHCRQILYHWATREAQIICDTIHIFQRIISCLKSYSWTVEDAG